MKNRELAQCEYSPRILSTFPTPLQTLPGDDTEHRVENYPALGEFSAGHSLANFNKTNSDHLHAFNTNKGKMLELHLGFIVLDQYHTP